MTPRSGRVNGLGQQLVDSPTRDLFAIRILQVPFVHPSTADASAPVDQMRGGPHCVGPRPPVLLPAIQEWREVEPRCLHLQATNPSVAGGHANGSRSSIQRSLPQSFQQHTARQRPSRFPASRRMPRLRCRQSAYRSPVRWWGLTSCWPAVLLTWFDRSLHRAAFAHTALRIAEADQGSGSIHPVMQRSTQEHPRRDLAGATVNKTNDCGLQVILPPERRLTKTKE